MSCRLLVVIFNTWSDLLFQKIKELEGQNDTLKMELHQMHEKSLVSQKPSTSNTLFSIIRWVIMLIQALILQLSAVFTPKRG